MEEILSAYQERKSLTEIKFQQVFFDTARLPKVWIKKGEPNGSP